MHSLEQFLKEIAALLVLMGAVMLLGKLVDMEEKREEFLLQDQAYKSAVIMDAARGGT